MKHLFSLSALRAKSLPFLRRWWPNGLVLALIGLDAAVNILPYRAAVPAELRQFRPEALSYSEARRDIDAALGVPTERPDNAFRYAHPTFSQQREEWLGAVGIARTLKEYHIAKYDGDLEGAEKSKDILMSALPAPHFYMRGADIPADAQGAETPMPFSLFCMNPSACTLTLPSTTRGGLTFALGDLPFRVPVDRPSFILVTTSFGDFTAYPDFDCTPERDGQPGKLFAFGGLAQFWSVTPSAINPPATGEDPRRASCLYSQRQAYLPVRPGIALEEPVNFQIETVRARRMQQDVGRPLLIFSCGTKFSEAEIALLGANYNKQEDKCTLATENILLTGTYDCGAAQDCPGGGPRREEIAPPDAEILSLKLRINQELSLAFQQMLSNAGSLSYVDALRLVDEPRWLRRELRLLAMRAEPNAPPSPPSIEEIKGQEMRFIPPVDFEGKEALLREIVGDYLRLMGPEGLPDALRQIWGEAPFPELYDPAQAPAGEEALKRQPQLRPYLPIRRMIGPLMMADLEIRFVQMGLIPPPARGD